MIAGYDTQLNHPAGLTQEYPSQHPRSRIDKIVAWATGKNLVRPLHLQYTVGALCSFSNIPVTVTFKTRVV